MHKVAAAVEAAVEHESGCKCQGPKDRLVGTIFGKVRYWRTYIYRGSAGYYPLDIELGLPRDGFSMLLRSHAAKIATKMSYAQCVAIIGATTVLSPQIAAVSEIYDVILKLTIESGRFFTRVDIDNRNLVCVLGNGVSKRLGAIGNPGHLFRIHNHLFRVVGVLAGMDPVSEEHTAFAIRDFNNMVFVPIGTERFIKIPEDALAGKGTEPSFPGEDDSKLDEIVVQMRDAEAVLQAAGMSITVDLHRSVETDCGAS